MKKNKLKNALALATACTMSLSLCAPAFAAGSTASTVGNQSALEFNGELESPTINVAIPDPAGGMSINPYNLKVSIGHTANGAAGAIISDQGVLSAVYGMENTSNVPLSVGVLATVAAEGEVVINEDGVIDHSVSGEKEVYVYIEFGQNAKKVDVSEGQDGSEFEFGADFIGGYAAQPNQYLIPTANEDGTLPTTIGILPAYTDTNDDGAYDESDDDVPGYAAFIFAGDARTNTDTAWGSTDKVKASVVFSLNPLGDPVIIRPGATDAGYVYTPEVTITSGTSGTIKVVFDKDTEAEDYVAIPVKVTNATLLDANGDEVTELIFVSTDSSGTVWALEDPDTYGSLTLVEGLKDAKTTITVTAELEP